MGERKRGGGVTDEKRLIKPINQTQRTNFVGILIHTTNA